VNNVRRRARRRFGQGLVADRKVEEVVRRWKLENSDLVVAHLPERMPFNARPGRRLIPDAILAMLERTVKEPLRGLAPEERARETKELYERHERWRAEITEDEYDALRNYSFTGFENINGILRRKSARDRYSSVEEHNRQRYHTKIQVENIDSALRKGDDFDEPQRLFRFYALPHGVSPEQFIERYLREGESFKDSAYLSTTRDPEFAMAKIQAGNKGSRTRAPQKHLMFEIISRRGRSMQRTEREKTLNIQALEKEILLPRNTKFRIAGVRLRQRYEYASDRPDLASTAMGNAYGFEYQKDAHEGQRIMIPTVQLVDEELI